MGETQHVFATSAVECGAQDRDLRFEPFSKKDGSEAEGRLLGSSKPHGQTGSDKGTHFSRPKEKEPHGSQREAVIRPQQAGKIDFKSLHNQPRFTSEGSWGAAKGSPLSPTGKGRLREKSSRRAGKGERGHQQLYRLTLSSARPGPTIGIAYPQQKVTPPKKIEVARGPPSGSYRFPVPEREAERQPEELGFAPCFSEVASNQISSIYTSPVATACPSYGAKGQPLVPVPPENPGTKGLFHHLEFQSGGSSSWLPPNKCYPGASGGLSGPKPSTHTLGPLSFLYHFPPPHGSAANLLPGDAEAQDYVDVSLPASQASHGAYAFDVSSREWKEEGLGSGPYNTVTPESRIYGVSPQPAPFLLPQTQGLPPCYKGRNEPPGDRNGAISPPGAIDKNPSTFHESQAAFQPSLHAPRGPKLISGRQPPGSKDNVASPRVLDSGSSLRRNGRPVPLPHVLFPSEVPSDLSASSLSPSSAPFEKNLPTPVQARPRLLQAWERGRKTEQSSAGYPSLVGSQLSLEGHLGSEPRQPVKNAWQHLYPTSAMSGLKRVELSRKLPFPISPSEWDEGRKVPQSPTSYPSKTLVSRRRQSPAPLLICSSGNGFCFEGTGEGQAPPEGVSRSNPLFLTGGQAVFSRHPSSPNGGLPASALATSPKDSPRPSPAPNLNCSCSSISPTTSSPTSHSFEDEVALATSPFLPHEGYLKEGSKPFHTSDLLTSCAANPQMADPIKPFHLSHNALRDGHFQKPDVQGPQRCPEVFENELPPPPYPYSSRHFLASSLSSTSLDQLDVLLTCKQCDQNFSNLSSLLDHRQFCGSHGVLQGQAKESSRGTEVKKPHLTFPESMKHTQASLGMLLSSDPHLQLLALNKTIDFLVEAEGKGDSKDDPLKMNPLGAFSGNSLPLSSSDLEIDDAKLDSLITEALNGLGYQSDNPEIDSSFIDVFADEELASVKVTSSGTAFKAKENLTLGKKAKHTGVDENTKMLNGCDDRSNRELAKSRTSKQHRERGANQLSDLEEERLGTPKSTELSRNKTMFPTRYGVTQEDPRTQLKVGRNSSPSLLPTKQVAQAISGMRQTKSFNSTSGLVSELKPAGAHSVAQSTPLSKKRKLRKGSWSKELIHKIVQQKNKLHKLHPKSSKAVSLPLLTHRLAPQPKDSKFGEYEYVSESDDERVEYAKRHCRRKPGARFSRRPRSGLSSRSQGRRVREKEKEPVWRRGLRKGQEGPPKFAGKELRRRSSGRAKGRRRRRRRESSNSSCQSISWSSDTSNSPERGDSDTEKEGEPRKVLLQSSKGTGPLPGQPEDVLEKETVGKSHCPASGLLGESNKVAPTQIQPGEVKTFQTDSPNTHKLSDESSLEGRGKPHRAKASPGSGPTPLLCPEDPEELNSGESERPKGAVWQSLEAENPPGPRYATYKELPGPHSTSKQSSPSGDGKCSKKPKDLIAPTNCFCDPPVGPGIAGKVAHLSLTAAGTFYDGKDSSSAYKMPVFLPGPLAVEPPHGGSIYLCQGDFEMGSFKEKPHEAMPYNADSLPSKGSSPFGFDSSSLFGEFSIAELDANLYDSVGLSKASYSPFPCDSQQLGKMIPFDQPYASFLPEKDWSLMGEGSPVLPEDAAEFHRLPAEKPTGKRYSSEMNSLSLSERISDYNMHFMSGLSDDELEIKRLVTELESQLQTNKLNMETPEEAQATVIQASLGRKGSTSELLPLGLDQDQDGKGLFLMEAEFENTPFLSTKAFGCENATNEETLLPSLESKYDSRRDPWPCAASFSPLNSSAHVSSAADLILIGPFSPQEDQRKFPEHLKDVEISGEADFGEIKTASPRIGPNSRLTDLSDNTGVPSYTEHLTQSPESIFPKSLEASELNAHEVLPLRARVFPNLPLKEQMFEGSTKLESYDHRAPELEPRFGLQDIGAQETDGNLPSHIQSQESEDDPKSGPPEKLENTAFFQSSQDEHLGKADKIACQASAVNARADSEKTLPFDGLILPKEMDGGALYESDAQGETVNPLQELQLFVARTVKNNEDDLVVLPLPTQHPVAPLSTHTGLHPETEEEPRDKEQKEEVTSSSVLEKRTESRFKKNGNPAELPVPAKPFPEAERQAEHFDGWGSDVSEELSPARCSHGSHQPLKGGCLEGDEPDRHADGISLEHSNPSSLNSSEAASTLGEKTMQQGQFTGEAEGDQEEKTLTFKAHRTSLLSPGPLEKETPRGALPGLLQVHAASCPSWGKACTEDKELGTAKKPQAERSGDRLRHQQLTMSLAPVSSPENQTGDDPLLQKRAFPSGTGSDSTEGPGSEKQARSCAEASQVGFSPDVGSVGQKQVLKPGTGNGTGPDFGAVPPEESPGRIATASQHLDPRMCRYPCLAEKTVVPSKGPSEQKDGKGTLPFSPTCDAISHLPSEMAGCLAEDTDHDLTEPPKTITQRYSSSLCSSKVAPSSTKAERPLTLQMNDCKVPCMLPLESQNPAEERSKHPGHEDDGVCSPRDELSGSQSASLHDILLSQLPSGTGSAKPGGARSPKNVSLTSKPQEAQDFEGGPQEGYFRKDVVQGMPVVITEIADANADHLNAGPVPPSESQEVSNVENKDAALAENMEEFSSSLRQEETKRQKLRTYCKTAQAKAKKKTGLQTTCNICSISFRSKTGLMRHEAVKHQKRQHRAFLVDSDCAPLEITLKTAKGLSRKNRKIFIKEKAGGSVISKAACRSSPKSHRRQKKEPEAEIQRGASRELSGLNVILLAQAHEFQRTDETQPISSQRGRSNGPQTKTRNKAGPGKLAKGVSTKRPDRCTGGKLKGKSREAKITSNKNEGANITLLQESVVPSTAIPSTEGLLLTTVTELLEAGSPCCEEQAEVRVAGDELEDVRERPPSAQRASGQQLLQNLERCREERKDAAPEPNESVKGRESGPYTEPKQSPLEEMNSTNQESLLVYVTSPSNLSHPCHPSEKDFPTLTSEKALGDDAPYFVGSKPWRTEDPQPQTEPPTATVVEATVVEPDLQSLFDDDATFSQLFPRDDQFARRKCTRVYGKQSKKPKPVAEVVAKPEGTADIFTIRMASDLGETSSFYVTREDPCEYDTISIDDALMLNMCHGSKSASGDVGSKTADSKILQLGTGQKEGNGVENGTAASVLCQESPTGPLPNLNSWGNLEKTAEDGTLLGPSMELTYGPSVVEDSPEPPELEEEPDSSSPKAKPPSSACQTSGMEMLSTTFVTKDMCFCSLGEDHRGHTDDRCTFKPTSVLQGRPIKSKLEEAKQGKPRSDLNFKTKDKQYKCKVCFQWFLTLGELDFHKLTHNPSPPPTCYMCVQRKFSSREQLRDHLKEKHAKNKAGLWACGMCLKEISDVWMYNEHLREHATQFARKGQAQKSALGLPGRLSEKDAAVSHFLNSLICRKPGRSSKHVEGHKAPGGPESRSPRESSGQETTGNRDWPEIPFGLRPPVASLKAPAAPSPGPAAKVEGAQKPVPIHPECKDPSRDCHHCGKQFPKPFKLQRHLVVHSLQKIFLCHKCPKFYQETKELRSHLSQGHGIAGEADVKHTTLYACELCADVMHVIKKSFICSTCNYTFSKKEQYDRHMEKHLVGSSKSFRFRGVMRPGTVAKCGGKDVKGGLGARAEAPETTRREMSVQNSSLLPVDGAQHDSEHLPPPGQVLSTEDCLPSHSPAQASRKTDSLVSEFSSLFAERGKSPLDSLLPSLPLEPQDESNGPELRHIPALSPEVWAEGEQLGHGLTPFLNSPDALSMDLVRLAHKKPMSAEEKCPPAHLSEKNNKERSVPERATLSSKVEFHLGTWDSPYLEDLASKNPELSPGTPGPTECKWSPETQWGSTARLNGTTPQDSVSKLHLSEASFPELPLKDKTSSSVLNQPAKEIPSKKIPSGQANSESVPGIHSPLGSAEDIQKGPFLRDKAFQELDAPAQLKDSSSEIGIKGSAKPGNSHLQGDWPAVSQSKPSHSDLGKFPERSAASRLSSLPSRKLKDPKSSHRKSSASRENMEGDGSKKRKVRSQDPMKGDSARKVDWPTSEALALSPRRRDPNSKPNPKLKVSVTGGQLRKVVLEPCFQKKMAICRANGEFKPKKEALGNKALHHLLAKGPVSSLRRHRTVQGAKLPSSRNYRTAESQNHLLSQLFGQKLTTFKIPLRRETSE